MVKLKNSSEIKNNVKIKITPKKSVYSVRQVDGIVKRNKDIKIEEKVLPQKNEVLLKDKKSKIIPLPETEVFEEEVGPSLDDNKRTFLKVAGVAGLGLAASTLFPKGANAYIAGSTPSSNVVGVKNISNTKINPATEDTLSSVKSQTDKFTFDIDGKLLTSTSGGSSIVGVKNIADVRINPATEESLVNVGQSVNDQSLWMLRKIITLLKPLGMTTGAQSNRLSIDVNSGNITATVSTVTTVSSLTNMVNIGNVNAFSLMKDSARNAYSNSIRSKISF